MNMKTLEDLIEYCIKTTKENDSDIVFEYLGYIQSISVIIYPKGIDKNSKEFFYYPYENILHSYSVNIETKSVQEINDLIVDIIEWINKVTK